MLSHAHPFDPTYGYDLDALLKVGSPEPPADFQAFWRDTYDAALAQPLVIDRRPSDAPAMEHFEIFDIHLTSFGGQRVGGWLLTPRHERPQRGVVAGHGYGGCAAPSLPDALEKTPTAWLLMCSRGLPARSLIDGLRGEAAWHVLRGIDSRETYIHRGCVADVFASASALLEMFPQVEGDLCYRGTSFGGGIGALALATDRRFRRAYLGVPSFGNHPLRVTLACVGSGAAVRRKWQSNPAVLEVLRYFDAATAARFIQAPTLFGCALFDPAVPPPGQFAVHNAAACEKRLHVRDAGHHDWPGAAAQEQAVAQAVQAWFEGEGDRRQ